MFKRTTMNKLKLRSLIISAPAALIAAAFAGTPAIAQSTTVNSAGSTVTISTGSYNNVTSGGGIGYQNAGTVTVTGGTFSDNGFTGFYNLDNGIVTVTGGTFDDDNGEGLVNEDSGAANIEGGTFDGNAYGLFNFANMTITGGSFSGDEYGLVNSGTGTVTIYGTSFSGDGVPTDGFGTDTSSGGNLYVTFVGSNTPELITFDNQGTINLDLVPVTTPEPTSLAAMGIGTLSLGILLLGTRRRRHLARG